MLCCAFRYKKQVEDAEEIAALNLAKYRKAQQQLEDADERTQNAEGNMGRIRHERATSMLVSEQPWALGNMGKIRHERATSMQVSEQP